MTHAPTRVLFVCTANECRSPFAEALARREAGDAPIEFASAGVHAWRRPMPALGQEVARESGLDLAAHISRSVHPDELATYDLVLGMSRSHARELLALDGSIRPRLFTLKQAARWFEAHSRPPRAALGSWLDAVAADRPRTELLGSRAADDVADPLNQPIEDWRSMSAELHDAIGRILAGIFPR